MTRSIYPRVGHYRVIDWDDNDFREYIVGVGGTCSCGGRQNGKKCAHIQAVEEFLVGGGARAARREEPQPQAAKMPPESCPVCGGKVRAYRPYRCRTLFWDCENSVAHFWEWYGGEAVKKFLTDRTHPNKAGPFYRKEIVVVCLMTLLLLLTRL